MVPIFIGSVSRFSGKNLIGLGLGMRFQQAGLKVGYFKPIGMAPRKIGDTTTDVDAEFFAEALSLTEPLEQICPVTLTREFMREALGGQATDVKQKIRDAYNKVSADKDVLIIGGIGNLHNGLFVDAPQIDFIRDIGAKAIILDNFEISHDSLDGFLWAKDTLADNLAGVIFNRVSTRTVDFLNQYAVPFLEKKGVRTLGIIPKDPILGAAPVRDLSEILHADVLCCDDQLDELVEHVTIGAMNVESALRHFRMVHNKAVITGGDRSDIQLAALETSTRCLILTGELYPNDLIVGRAQQAKVPILVVRHATADTVERCEHIMGRLSLRNEKKLNRALEIIDTQMDLKGFGEMVGLKL